MTDSHRRYVMYGAEFSLYSGKLRSYLRKKGIAFEERSPSILTYKRFIVPRTGVRYIPVLHTPDDEVLQDTTAIIDALEARHPEPSAYPTTPRQHLAALLLELFGDEWLLIPAMHYRWNFPEVNLPFIHDEFGTMAFPWFPRSIRRLLGKKISARFQGFVPRLGITETMQPAIETAWLGLLNELNRHFSDHNFLLGSCPSIGDFGLIGPLYAHLYRDPYPGALMREHAPAVAAWVERMIASQPADGSFLTEDVLAPTLLPVLERMAREQVPVLVDTEKRLAKWAQSHPTGTEIPRILGEHHFELEGQRGIRVVLPYSLWRWQRPRDYLQSLTPDQRAATCALARQLGIDEPLLTPPRVRVERHNNRFLLV